jgi:hypothetical protein
VIELRAGFGLIGIRDVFAKVVDRNASAELIDCFRCSHCIRNRGSGHKAAGGALSETGALGDVPEPAALRESYESCPQHGTPGSGGIELPESSVGIDSNFYHKQ